MSRPSGVMMSQVMLSLLRAWLLKLGERFQGRSPGSQSGKPRPVWPAARMASTCAFVTRCSPPRVEGWTCCNGSTRMTSAPHSANNCVQ